MSLVRSPKFRLYPPSITGDKIMVLGIEEGVDAEPQSLDDLVASSAIEEADLCFLQAQLQMILDVDEGKQIIDQIPDAAKKKIRMDDYLNIPKKGLIVFVGDKEIGYLVFCEPKERDDQTLEHVFEAGIVFKGKSEPQFVELRTSPDSFKEACGWKCMLGDDRCRFLPKERFKHIQK